jgi:hypothetical protein
MSGMFSTNELVAELASLRTRVAELEGTLAAYADARDPALNEFMARAERAEAALRYISRPSLGWDQGRDGDFIPFIQTASESNVRIALRACVETARQALAATTEEDG